MKPMTSTEINSAARVIGEEKAIELYAKAGFDAWDFSMFEMGRYDWSKNELLKTGHPLQSDYRIRPANKPEVIGRKNPLSQPLMN